MPSDIGYNQAGKQRTMIHFPQKKETGEMADGKNLCV